MKTYARVVVIGGGIAGCSTLYHLTEQGWHDVVLVAYPLTITSDFIRIHKARPLYT